MSKESHDYKGKSIPKEDWGIWDEENDLYKYPLDTEEHVRSAIKLFGHYADTKYAKELADNILKHMKKYDIPLSEIGENNKLRNYIEDNNEEVIGNKKAYPVFIVTSFTFTPLGKIITKLQKSEVSHASIGFDADLEHLYTFAMSPGDVVGGLRVESLSLYANSHPDAYIRVTTIFLKKNDYVKLRNKIEDMMTNVSKYTYNFAGLVNVLLNKESSLEYKMICSEFVVRVLEMVDIKLDIDKANNLVSPKDIHNHYVNNNKMYVIYDGYCRDYKIKDVLKTIKSIQPKSEYIKEHTINSLQYQLFHEDTVDNSEIIVESIITEAKEFPIDFEKDGSVVIKNYKKLDFEAEYAKSHKLLMLYEKTNNLEGIKYELSKLWFMNNVLEKRIYSNPSEDKLKEYTKARAKILNDFNKYLKFVLEREPNFNFTEYYNNSPYSDVAIRIPGSLIVNLFNLIKQIL